MKVWHGFGSEHSARLVMIGRFKTINDATEAKRALDMLIQQVEADNKAAKQPEGEKPVRYSEGMLALLEKVKIFSIAPEELGQLTYQVDLDLEDKMLVFKTDEIDISAFLKVLLDRGARVEIYSMHDYPAREGEEGKQLN